MNCSEVQALLSAFYDGELAGDVQLGVSQHLDHCSDCASDLSRFVKVSEMVAALGTPLPPGQIWRQLEQQLDRRPQSAHAGRRWRPSLPVPRMVAWAALVLVALSLGWFAYRSWMPHGRYDQFAAEFGQYLDEFHRDPQAAQQLLVAKYAGQAVGPEQVIQRVGYRPAVADGLPQGYSVGSTYVMTMPCCTCVQTVCRRSDGSTLAIFEHDDQEPEWFGDRRGIMTHCSGQPCCLVELDDRIAASWKRDQRHLTLIGVRDVAEVSELVAWFDRRR